LIKNDKFSKILMDNTINKGFEEKGKTHAE